MHVALVQQLAAHRLAGAALEEHVVRHDDGRAAVDLQDVAHVLHEVELLVAGRGPEVVAHDGLGFAADFALVGDKGDAALFAKGRVGEHHIEVFAGMAGQRIIHADGAAAPPLSANAVQVEVHHAQPRGVVHDLPAVQRLVVEVRVLVAVEWCCSGDVLVRGDKEAAGARQRDRRW